MTDSKPELNMTRVFNAKPEMVFKMWTEPEHIAKWWGPKGFTVPVESVKIDLQPGGNFFLNMKSPDGKIMPNPMTVKEVDPPKRLVLSMVYPQGAMENIITFTEEKGKTRMDFKVIETIEMPGPRSALDGLDKAWGMSFDKLEAAL